ncbi:hypothetical protein [Clostridium sp.]|uniref:hypothetical protein n=1 Tax=Clostridium sp. TaxID=1506 RepID=UPI0032163E17
MTYTDKEYELMAIQVIRKYLNKDFTNDEIKYNYSLALMKLINNSKEIETYKKVGVKSVSEGNQSMSFETNVEAWTITADVKAFLPTPFIRMY